MTATTTHEKALEALDRLTDPYTLLEDSETRELGEIIRNALTAQAKGE